MYVYPAEQSDGLSEQLAGHGKAYLTAKARPTPAPVAPLLTELAQAAVANPNQPDLYYLSFVLVSAGVNGNGDYFDKNELWKARSTPEDKQFNYQHNHTDIIGHMTGCRAVANDQELSGGDDELPDFYDLVGEAVLYRLWPEHQDLQERMDLVVAELEAGDWFVSMECLFPTFDYYLCPVVDGEIDLAKGRIIARSANTAFLTKHLRAYGGSGMYQGQAVCRLLREIVFSGVGLVRDPANPKSVVLTASAEDKNFPVSEPVGYSPASASKPTESMMTIEQYEKMVQDLKAELEAAKASATADKVQALETKVTQLAEELDTAAKALTASQDEFKTAEAARVELAKSLEAAQEVAKAAEAKLNTIETEREADRRHQLVKASLSLSDEDAKAYADKLKLLPTVEFDAAVAATKGFIKAVPTPEVPALTVAQASAAVNEAVIEKQVAAVTVPEKAGLDIAKAAQDIDAFFDSDEAGDEKPAKKGRK